MKLSPLFSNFEKFTPRTNFHLFRDLIFRCFNVGSGATQHHHFDHHFDSEEEVDVEID